MIPRRLKVTYKLSKRGLTRSDDLRSSHIDLYLAKLHNGQRYHLFLNRSSSAGPIDQAAGPLISLIGVRRDTGDFSKPSGRSCWLCDNTVQLNCYCRISMGIPHNN